MFFRRFIITLGSSVLLALATFACSDDADEAATPIVGVNDVVQACAIRAQWTRPSSIDCTDCLGMASTPLCDCTSVKDYAGKCSDQQNAKNQEADCTSVGGCAVACPVGDCACVEACYANKDACRVRASALDGCLAEVCDTHCR